MTALTHSEHGEPNCLNCGTALVGHWCHGCGQKAASNHRSLLHLGAEYIEALSHADSRAWHTLRLLVLDPARLTRDYLLGKRASEIPPLRLFFMTLFLLFGIGALTQHAPRIETPDTKTQQESVASIQALTIEGSPRLTLWLRRHLAHAVERPDEVIAVMSEWLERFTFLMLPIAGCLLWLLYLGRGFSMHDHMIFAMHSLSFVSLVSVAFLLLDLVLPNAALLLFLVPPVHLYKHMRGVYGSGGAGTLLRMVPLGIGSLLGIVLLLAVLAAMGLEFGAATGAVSP